MINLLPPNYKNAVRRERKQKLLMIFEFLFLVFLISVSLIFFAVKIYIQSQVDSMKVLSAIEEKTALNLEVLSLKEKIAAANKNLSQLKNFYQGQKSIIGILDRASQTIPEGISLSELSWRKNNSQISISGNASLREILFDFKQTLEKNFTEVSFPPSIWIKPSNINFSITFKLKP